MKKNRLVCGVGINDSPYSIHTNSGFCKFYSTWKSMLTRVYCGVHPTYKETEVCTEWLTFSNFKKWMESQDYEGKELDKDLLIKGNKLYSPETCVFISRRLNMFLTERNKCRGNLPIGVSFDKDSNKFRAQISNGTGKIVNLGRFNCPENAHRAWLEEKYRLAKILASEETDEKIINSLLKRYIPK